MIYLIQFEKKIKDKSKKIKDKLEEKYNFFFSPPSLF